MVAVLPKRRILSCLTAPVSLKKGQMLFRIPVGWTASRAWGLVVKLRLTERSPCSSYRKSLCLPFCGTAARWEAPGRPRTGPSASSELHPGELAAARGAYEGCPGNTACSHPQLKGQKTHSQGLLQQHDARKLSTTKPGSWTTSILNGVTLFWNVHAGHNRS